jgi:hypothetical protein
MGQDVITMLDGNVRIESYMAITGNNLFDNYGQGKRLIYVDSIPTAMSRNTVLKHIGFSTGNGALRAVMINTGLILTQDIVMTDQKINSSYFQKSTVSATRSVIDGLFQ